MPGEIADPYRVWLSEIMLQQTTVATVGPYFERFMARWPTVHALAEASLGEVLQEWQGLGYYARARNLHRCARAVVNLHDGRFPDDETGLLELPGIGLYTAAAIAAIAFDRRAVVVDGNVERVVARLHCVETVLPAAKAELRRLAATLTPDSRPGDYAQAMMDLGALICTPTKPICPICPVRRHCRAHDTGNPAKWPNRVPRRARPLRRGVLFWIERADGSLLLRRRPEEGLLGGLMEFPSTAWREAPWTIEEALSQAPCQGTWHPVAGTVSHGFTHFELELEVVHARIGRKKLAGVWVQPDALGDHALPTLMRRVARHMGISVRPRRAGDVQLSSARSL